MTCEVTYYFFSVGYTFQKSVLLMLQNFFVCLAVAYYYYTYAYILAATVC